MYFPAQLRRLGQGGEKLPEGKSVKPFRPVGIPGSGRREGGKGEFPLQGFPLSVGPAVFQDQVDPLLEQGRCAVHVDGVLPYDDVMG